MCRYICIVGKLTWYKLNYVETNVLMNKLFLERIKNDVYLN